MLSVRILNYIQVRPVKTPPTSTSNDNHSYQFTESFPQSFGGF